MNTHNKSNKSEKIIQDDFPTFSYDEVRHRYLDLHLNHRSLAARLSAKGLKVSTAYLYNLLSGKSPARSPYSRLIMQQVAEELGIGDKGAA